MVSWDEPSSEVRDEENLAVEKPLAKLSISSVVRKLRSQGGKILLMRMFVLRWCSAGFLSLALAMLLTSCLSPAVSSQVPNAPSNLHVDVIIQQSSPAGTSASISVKFFDPNNNFIEFAAGETIACDGTFLAFHDDAFLGFHVDSYTGQIPVLPVGASYSCIYRIPDGTKATITIPSQKPLVFLSPANGTRVTIPKTTHTLSMLYTPAHGHTLSGFAQDSMGREALGKSEQDSGTYILDDSEFSTFAPGAGTLSLTRGWTFTPTRTGFQSVDVAYNSTHTVQIIWV
jgi:hypothetical protein